VCGTDHFSQAFLADLGNDGLRIAFLPEIRDQLLRLPQADAIGGDPPSGMAKLTSCPSPIGNFFVHTPAFQARLHSHPPELQTFLSLTDHIFIAENGAGAMQTAYP
jgi:hypothetical protein